MKPQKKPYSLYPDLHQCFEMWTYFSNRGFSIV